MLAMVVLGLIASACSAADSDPADDPTSAGSPTTPAPSPSLTSETAASTPSTPSTPTAAPSTAIVGLSRRPPPVNQTVLDHPAGLRLTLVVGGTLRYRQSDDIALSLTVRNVGTEPVFHDSNQPINFGLYRTGSSAPLWTDRTCAWQFRGGAPTTGPLSLPPGEEVAFLEHYPVGVEGRNAGVGPDPDSCRVPPGRYAVTGFFDRCPPEAMVPTSNGNPYCDQEKVEHIAAKPLTIEIAP